MTVLNIRLLRNLSTLRKINDCNVLIIFLVYILHISNTPHIFQLFIYFMVYFENIDFSLKNCMFVSTIFQYFPMRPSFALFFSETYWLKQPLSKFLGPQDLLPQGGGRARSCTAAKLYSSEVVQQ